ncbi:hypothetical protein OG921_26320 [Aldersonia sp. NBC_00410]|uniref:hypothetical protein n=1 Tax=Aldersonia sp. NBC_00410 TaxID=2975954 RepID=UPI0022568358|nr:hypothetical protein [Aldersonia sp. NBC_00410]MCX5046695.1 hypothetical protein [Aldersonia sp. NBC_00410]
MTGVADELAAHKARIDRKYAVRGSRDEAVAAVCAAERGTPVWLLIGPDGDIDGYHAYRVNGWDSVENVWRSFEPRKGDREALQRAGWTVRRDDADGTGMATFRAADVTGFGFD